MYLKSLSDNNDKISRKKIGNINCIFELKANMMLFDNSDIDIKKWISNIKNMMKILDLTIEPNLFGNKDKQIGTKHKIEIKLIKNLSINIIKGYLNT